MSRLGFILGLVAVFGFAAGAANAGSRLGPDAPVQFAQGKKNGDKGKGDNPPGFEKKGGAPAPGAPTNHESGVHGLDGRDSGTFGTPSGQRGTREVPEGR